MAAGGKKTATPAVEPTDYLAVLELVVADVKAGAATLFLMAGSKTLDEDTRVIADSVRKMLTRAETHLLGIVADMETNGGAA